MTIASYINPESLHSNPAFTQVVRVSSAADTIYIGGQNGVDKTGQVVGPDLASQARQALRNVRACVEAAGGTIENIVKWTIFVEDGQPIQDGFGAFLELWGSGRIRPPSPSCAWPGSAYRVRSSKSRRWRRFPRAKPGRRNG